MPKVRCITPNCSEEYHCRHKKTHKYNPNPELCGVPCANCKTDTEIRELRDHLTKMLEEPK